MGGLIMLKAAEAEQGSSLSALENTERAVRDKNNVH